MKKINKSLIMNVILILSLILLIFNVILIFNFKSDKTNLSEISYNKSVNMDKYENLINLSKKNNVIVKEKVIIEIKDYFNSFFPNETIIKIYGKIDLKNNTILIDNWKTGEIVRSSDSSAIVRLSYNPLSDKNYIGTIHNHPNGFCELSKGDIISYDKQRFINEEVMGIICGNFMVLYTYNFSSSEFIKFVYMIENE